MMDKKAHHQEIHLHINDYRKCLQTKATVASDKS